MSLVAEPITGVGLADLLRDTRHLAAFGHWLREQGFDLEERKILMGHESIRTTEHFYGRVTVEDVAAKIAGLRL